MSKLKLNFVLFNNPVVLKSRLWAGQAVLILKWRFCSECDSIKMKKKTPDWQDTQKNVLGDNEIAPDSKKAF